MGCKVSRARNPTKIKKSDVSQETTTQNGNKPQIENNKSLEDGKVNENIKPAENIAVKPVVIFILGGPGSGKGTLCDQLVKECHFIHFSTGDLLRKEQEENSESDLSKTIKQLMTDGKLVPSGILVDLIRNAIKKLNGANVKILLDGFPRNQENIDVWKEKKMEEDCDARFCLFLECGFETMEKRLLGRAETSGRADDNPETIKKRFETYENETKPILEFFETKNKLVKANAESDPMTVFNAVIEKLKEKGLQ